METRGLFKLMTPMVARMGQRQEETVWANLEHLLEGQATPPLQTVSMSAGVLVEV